LYYKMDYNVAMQIVDKQTIYIKFPENKGLGPICLINMQLHRHGEVLYAVIVQNTIQRNQRWKIIDYNNINEAFMTKKELINKYGLFDIDLPKGSKVKYNNFNDLKDRINVNEQLIRTTKFSDLRIVTNKKNNDKNGALEINERRFRKLALKSWSDNELISIAKFKFRKNQYHLEKLLLVSIPEHNVDVVVSFRWNSGRTHASAICLDLDDMKNKANLVDTVPSHSWINAAKQNMTIKSLKIIPSTTKKSKKCRKNRNKMQISRLNKAKSSPITSPSMLPQQTPISVQSKVSTTNNQKHHQQHFSIPQIVRMQSAPTSYDAQLLAQPVPISALPQPAHNYQYLQC